MKRRQLLQASAFGAAALTAPRLAQAADNRVLKFIPQADLAAVDPMWTTSYVTRNHGYMVYDTLYGLDEQYRPQLQMLQGHEVDTDGKLWRLTLREGLVFHDNTPVLARDAVASIRRWGRRDPFGQALLAVTTELSAPSDRVIQFRLSRPFPLLPNALGKAPSSMPCIMPERLAQTDAMQQVTEVVGSGPFRFVADERVQGSRFVYQKFAGYVPRDEPSSFTAGGKRVHFERVEWHVIPDASTAAAALQSGEMDWWEQPTIDLQPMLRKASRVTVDVTDPTGVIGTMRFNTTQPPFDDPAIRRALLGAINQSDFMTAIVGNDPALMHDKVGFFCPQSAMASTAGMEALSSPRDLVKVKEQLRAAGYRGQPTVLLGATDFPSIKMESQVGASVLQSVGMTVDYQAMDWGSVTQRRSSKAPPDKGGWSAFFTAATGLEMFDPTGHNQLRGNGKDAWFGWPESPRLEQLRDSWFAAGSLVEQQRICQEMQLQAFQDVPYIPLGQFLQATSYSRSLTGILKGGFALFHNVRRV
jgi:peptide/nickel transport system substrate-binding protein